MDLTTSDPAMIAADCLERAHRYELAARQHVATGDFEGAERQLTYARAYLRLFDYWNEFPRLLELEVRR